VAVPPSRFRADVSKVAEIDHLFAATSERFGGIDIVVANAGIELVDQRLLDFTEADFDRLFGVNTKGAFFHAAKGARHVRDNGRIIYVGSSTTRLPQPDYALYGASKIAPHVSRRGLASCWAIAA